MSTTEFDPIDLAMLGAGWTTAGESLTVEAAEFLTEVAKMLHRVYRELVGDDGWPGVWAYDIAEPLGTMMADSEEDLGAAENLARLWVTAELERTA